MLPYRNYLVSEVPWCCCTDIFRSATSRDLTHQIISVWPHNEGKGRRFSGLGGDFAGLYSKQNENNKNVMLTFIASITTSKNKQMLNVRDCLHKFWRFFFDVVTQYFLNLFVSYTVLIYFLYWTRGVLWCDQY